MSGVFDWKVLFCSGDGQSDDGQKFRFDALARRKSLFMWVARAALVF